MPSTDDHGSDDPTDVRSLAVTASDVVTAYEATRRSGREAVLRVTPPFAARMRARLHVAGGEGESYGGATAPVHVPPSALVDEGSVPSYPEVDDTEDELRDRGAYTPERHRERHRARVEAWRAAVREAIVDRAAIETPAGSHAVEIKRLG